MALTTQLSIQMENRRGALSEVCSELAKVAVNISGISAPDLPGKGAIRIVAAPVETARKVLAKMGLPFKEETVLTVHLPERPGALGRVTRKLADKGIDVLYAYGTIEHGSERAMVVMGVSDPEAASQIVK
ncbi:MAG: ACT domain-containing protein [Terriglobia bacterium]